MGKYLKSIALFLLITTIIISLAACTNTARGEKQYAVLKTSAQRSSVKVADNIKEVETLENIRNDILSLEPVYQVVVIKGEHETLVAYKVKQLHRFNMKKIEKDIQERLNKQYPDEDFVISSDFKIYLEASELYERTKQPNYPEEKEKKQLQKIIKLKKELT